MLIIHSHFLTLPQDQICLANLVAGLGFEPKTFGLCLLLQLSLLRHKSWRIYSPDYTFPPSLKNFRFQLRRTCRLVSTPSLDVIQGLGSVLPVKASPNLTGNLPLHCCKDAHIAEPDELPDCSTPQFYSVVFRIIGLYLSGVNAF